MALAGFSAGEAEGLRRAMSRKRSEEALNSYRGRFIEGAIARGVDEAIANGVYDQIKGFSGFGFPKSHAAAFGLLAYQSTWLRVHYGAEFLCGLLNEQPMGFYPPDALVHEAQRRGIRVLGPDVNASTVLCRCEWVEEIANGGAPGAERQLGVRIGLGYVTGLAASDAEAVVGRARGATAPTATSAISRPARAPPATGSRSWPGPTPARASEPAPSSCGRARRSTGGRRCGRSGSRAGRSGEASAAGRAAGQRAAAAAARSARFACARAPERLGAGHRRLQRLRDLAQRASDGADAGRSSTRRR